MREQTAAAFGTSLAPSSQGIEFMREMQQYVGPAIFIDPRNPFQKATRLLLTQQNLHSVAV